MAELLGNNAVITWTYGTAGTVTLNADYRTWSVSPSQDKYEITAGADSYKGYIRGAKDFTAQYTGMDQAGGTPTSGTVGFDVAFAMGTDGTLVVQPEGTATGKQKWTYPCFTTTDPETAISYNGPCEITISWQGNGAWTRSTN